MTEFSTNKSENNRNGAEQEQVSSQGGKSTNNKVKRSYVPPHIRRQMEQQVVSNGIAPRVASTGVQDAPSKPFNSRAGAFRTESGAPGASPGSRERFGGGSGRAPAGARRWGATTASAPSSSIGAGFRGGSRAGNWFEDSNPYYSSGMGKPAESAAQSLPNEADDNELFNGQNTGINFDKYDDIPVEVSGERIVDEITSFESSGMERLLLRNISLSGYKKPTPVQRHAIPTIMAGRDLMSCAQTGSGKTAAFVLPVLHKMLQMGGPAPIPSSGGSSGHMGRIRGSFPTYLILAPTRELASQIFSECKKFCNGTGIRAAVIYGGSENTREQLRAVENGVDIVVATPGRLLDFIERGRIGLVNVRFLTLDEADRMLDMGFEPQIRQIVEGSDMKAPGARQTLMFSATFPREIQRLASDFLYDYVFLAVGRVGSTTDFIIQKIEFCEDHLKREMLLDLLNSISGLTLVFVDTKRCADSLEDWLLRQGYSAASIHGDRTQREREDSLASFRCGQTPVLVATDVAARGLDIPNVAHVVNFELPSAIDDYVHRIGRTGRAGNQGIATAFVNEKNRNLLRDLIDLLNEAGQDVPPWLISMCSSAPRSGGSSGSRGGKGARFGGRDVRRDGGGAMRRSGAASHAGGREDTWGGGWRNTGSSAW